MLNFSVQNRNQSQESYGGSNTPTPQGSPGEQRRTFPGLYHDESLDLPPPEAAPPPIADDYDDPQELFHRPHPSQNNSVTPTRNSIAATHSNIMQSLNAKLAAKRSSVPLPTSPSLDSQSSEDITPTEQPVDSLMTQIRRGVPLRKTQTRDRSQPRIS